MTNYYGVDWILFALVFWHLVLLGNQKRSAFLVGMLATVFGVTFGVMSESLATTAMNITFCLLHWRAYLKWCHEQKQI
jgi:hypothetical protein